MTGDASTRRLPGVKTRKGFMPTAIDRQELVRLVEEEDAQVVDVLPDREYADSHTPNAINLPLRHLTEDTAAVLRGDRPVVVY
jgi:rhodanese-related sulfurtransferase